MPLSRSLTCLLLTLAAACPALAQQRPGKVPDKVFVPFEEFEKFFGKEKVGVFIPYADLKALVRKANADPTKVTKPPRVTPPADFVLVGARFEGVAGERVAHFTATFDVEVLEDRNWVVIPIGLGEASLEEVTTGGGKAVIAPMAVLANRIARLAPARHKSRRPALPQRGYGILVRGAGRIRTTAKFAIPVSSKPGESSFALKLPRAALTRFEVVLPQSGVKVGVSNALATEETILKAEDQTRVRAYFGEAASAKVTWNPKPKAVEGKARKPLLFAKTETSLWLDESVVQTRTRIDYQILNAPCGEFRVRVPKGYTIVKVLGANMTEEPEATDQNGGQEFTVRLHEKASSAYRLEVHLERILEKDQKTLAFPRVETIGTGREQGVLMARASEFISIEPTLQRDLPQLDASGLPAGLAAEWKALQSAATQRGKKIRPPLVFRYLRQPYTLELATNPIEPEVEGKVHTLALLRDNEWDLTTTIRYTIRKRGIFGVRIKLPQGFKIDPASLDERLIKDRREDGDVLYLEFVGQRSNRLDLSFRGTVNRDTNQPEKGEAKLDLPRFALVGVKQERGFLGVGGERHLKLTLDSGHTGLVPASIRELRELRFPHQVKDTSKEELTFGLRYSKPEGVKASFTAKKKESKVTARVESLVDAQEDQVKVKTTIRYTVEYAGVEKLRIEAPEDLKTDKDLKFEADGLIKDRQVELKDGKAIWTISLQSKKTGDFAIKCEYAIKLDGFQAGQQKPVKLKELKVLDCFSETGNIALKKHENLVITEQEMTNLTKRDKQELPKALREQGPIQAYRYVSHPHTLVLNITKYDFQAPLGILVKHLHQDEVVTRDGLLKAEAWLELQNNAEQFLTVLLPKGARMRGLQVDGKNEEWSEGQAILERPTVQVHLGEVTKTRKQAAFVIRLRYDLPADALGGSGSRDFQTLVFPLDKYADEPTDPKRQVPVARLTRSLFLPEGYAYRAFDTDATKHFDESSLWEWVKKSLGVRTGREREVAKKNGRAAQAVIARLKTKTPGRAEGGLYPDLELPQGREPFLFEKLDNPSRLSVSYVSWPLFFVLDVLILLAVVGLGVLLDVRKLVLPVVYVSVAAGLGLLGATFLGRALEPYFASTLLGAVGLGGFFLGRGVWRELTVNRHERRLAELTEQANLARARADAATRESGVPAPAAATPAPAPSAAATAKKKAAATAAEQAAADRIELADDAETAAKAAELKAAEVKADEIKASQAKARPESSKADDSDNDEPEDSDADSNADSDADSKD